MSLLSLISKVFEKLISIRVMSFIKKHSILSPMQCGFRPESSTEFAILDIVSSRFGNINDKLFAGLTMIDLKKAFDSVTHSTVSCCKTQITVFVAKFSICFLLILQTDNNM